MLSNCSNSLCQNPYPYQCGLRSNSTCENSGRIIDGQQAAGCAWPWQAALLEKRGLSFELFCGGAIYNQAESTLEISPDTIPQLPLSKEWSLLLVPLCHKDTAKARNP